MKRKVKQLPPPEYVLDHFRYHEEVYTRGGSVLGVWSVSRVRRLRAVLNRDLFPEDFCEMSDPLI